MPVRRAILALSLLAACSERPTAGFGAPCDGNAVCKSGICVSEGAAPRRGRCTRTCGPDAACPEGFSCSALTARGVAVCAQGSGVPELQLRDRRQ